METDLYRYISLAALTLFLSLGSWVYGRHVWLSAPVIRWSGLIVAGAFALGMVSIVVNLTSDVEQTPGVKVYGVGIAVLTVLLAGVCWRYRHD